MQKILVLACEDSLCPRKQPDVSGPGLGEAGHYTLHFMFASHLAQRACNGRFVYPLDDVIISPMYALLINGMTIITA